jgi:hypothetical protein
MTNEAMNLLMDVTHDISNHFGIYGAVAVLLNQFCEHKLCEIKTPIRMFVGYLRGAYIGYFWPITIPILFIKRFSPNY